MGLKRYTEIGDQNAAASDITILGLTSAATIRPHLFHITFGSDATPADQAFNMVLQRYTAAGTATSVTPVPQDPVESLIEGVTLRSGQMLVSDEQFCLRFRGSFTHRHRLPSLASDSVCNIF